MPQQGGIQSTRELALVLLKQHTWLIQRVDFAIAKSSITLPELDKIVNLQEDCVRQKQYSAAYNQENQHLKSKLKEVSEAEIKLRQNNSILHEKLILVEQQVKDLLIEQHMASQ